MSLELTILGCNSAIPSISRFTTSQILSSEGKPYMIDCGEGCQIRLNQYKVKKSKIDEIFISHFHGDHFFGLPGLITSFNLSSRTKSLRIYGPIGLKKFIGTLEEIGSFYLNFPLEIHELNPDISELIHKDENVEVSTLPLKHRIPTTGFLFREKEKPRKIDSTAIEKFKLSIPEIKQAKEGGDVLRHGDQRIPNVDITLTPKPRRAYAYCSDTIYDEELVDLISGTDLLYHEATYLHDMQDQARARGHATAREAAIIAKKSHAKRLLLGHFSSRYKDVSVFLNEALEVFPNCDLAQDGKTFKI